MFTEKDHPQHREHVSLASEILR